MWCDRIRDEIQGICQHHDVEQALRVGSLCHSTHRGAGLSSSPTHLYMRKTQSAPPPLGVAAAGTGPRESVVGHRGAHVLAPLPLSSVRQLMYFSVLVSTSTKYTITNVNVLIPHTNTYPTTF